MRVCTSCCVTFSMYASVYMDPLVGVSASVQLHVGVTGCVSASVQLHVGVTGCVSASVQLHVGVTGVCQQVFNCMWV